MKNKSVKQHCKFYTKTDSWFQKSLEEFGQLQRSSRKSKMLKFDGLLLSKKDIPSAKAYTDDLSNITFNYLCENSPNSLCHFWNQKSFFTTQICIFFNSNITYFLQKELIKVQNFRLSTAHVKFHQICTLTGSFCWKYIKFQLKSTEQLCLMTLKSDVKFEEKLICCFKNDKNLVNFDRSTQKSKKFALLLDPFVHSIKRLT